MGFSLEVPLTLRQTWLAQAARLLRAWGSRSIGPRSLCQGPDAGFTVVTHNFTKAKLFDTILCPRERREPYLRLAVQRYRVLL